MHLSSGMTHKFLKPSELLCPHCGMPGNCFMLRQFQKFPVSLLSRLVGEHMYVILIRLLGLTLSVILCIDRWIEVIPLAESITLKCFSRRLEKTFLAVFCITLYIEAASTSKRSMGFGVTEDPHFQILAFIPAYFGAWIRYLVFLSICTLVITKPVL